MANCQSPLRRFLKWRILEKYYLSVNIVIMYTSYLWIAFSYLLGSIPFGYIITRIFSGKNILEIGWRKTSGSNVYRNVGKGAGAITGILDLLKGFVVVFGAQQLGFSSYVQIFSGLAAILGHNWSIFLKFSGGRGIGTLFGAFLALHFKITLLSFISFLVLTLIWDASIGTLLFLFFSIGMAICFNLFWQVGLFPTLSFVPILIKRLSPIKEISKAEKPLNLFLNRIFFDNDNSLFRLNITKIYRKQPRFFRPITEPSKIGWRAAKTGAKYGAKIAAKPIEPVKKIIKSGINIFLPSEKVVLEIDQQDLKKMMALAAKKVVLYQEEINRLNVWPVADKDTGYNLAATLLGVEGSISYKDYISLAELSIDIKEGALMNARGNAGMIFTGYLAKLLDNIKHLKKIDAQKLGHALERATKGAASSILNPTEGTILDSMQAVGLKAFEASKSGKEKNIIKVLEDALIAGQEALEQTKDKMEVFKQNNVVDAGAFGFIKILEAWIEALKTGTSTLEPSPVLDNKRILKTAEEASDFKYEVVFTP